MIAYTPYEEIGASPAPWYAEKCDDILRRVFGADGKQVCLMSTADSRGIFNIPLLVSAPDLYKYTQRLCAEVRKVIKTTKCGNIVINGDCTGIAYALADAENALVKAGGSIM